MLSQESHNIRHDPNGDLHHLSHCKHGKNFDRMGNNCKNQENTGECKRDLAYDDTGAPFSADLVFLVQGFVGMTYEVATRALALT
jgi:hypothetical protein